MGNANGSTDKKNINSTFIGSDRIWSNDTVFYTAAVTAGGDHRIDGDTVDQ
jgi:hypothetical protein